MLIRPPMLGPWPSEFRLNCAEGLRGSGRQKFFGERVVAATCPPSSEHFSIFSSRRERFRRLLAAPNPHR
jgi:hypothetical protein